jgi:hypothetical protein
MESGKKAKMFIADFRNSFTFQNHYIIRETFHFFTIYLKEKKILSRQEGFRALVWLSSFSNEESNGHRRPAIPDIFPMNHLRLIIVEEEHEFAYKQSEKPRYQGGDASIYRAVISTT